MNGDKFGAVGECSLDLHVMNHFWNAVHNILCAEQGATEVHQLGNGSAVAGTFKDSGTDIGNGLRVVEFESSGLAALSEQCRCK